MLHLAFKPSLSFLPSPMRRQPWRLRRGAGGMSAHALVGCYGTEALQAATSRSCYWLQITFCALGPAEPVRRALGGTGTETGAKRARRGDLPVPEPKPVEARTVAVRRKDVLDKGYTDKCKGCRAAQLGRRCQPCRCHRCRS